MNIYTNKELLHNKIDELFEALETFLTSDEYKEFKELMEHPENSEEYKMKLISILENVDDKIGLLGILLIPMLLNKSF